MEKAIRCLASSRVVPVATQPGSSGTYAPNPDPPNAPFPAVYQGAGADFSSIAISEKGAPPISLPVTNASVQAQIKDKFQAGDRVTITFKGNAVQSLAPETIAITVWDRILAL